MTNPSHNKWIIAQSLHNQWPGYHPKRCVQNRLNDSGPKLLDSKW